MCGLVIAASAAAQTNSFDIPEGDLKVALEAYARQSGVRLVYLSEDVRDRRTAGARGDMSQDAALNRLLAGTGLTVKRDQSGALAIVREGANTPTPTPTPTRNAPSSGVGQAGPDAYSASLSGGADASTPSTASPTTFDAVQVTGSHIKRAQMSGVGPTTVIDAETIQSSGAVSVETLLQRLPASAGAAGSQSNNFWTGNGNGTTQINLRGLGVNRTLVLLNGRRVVNGGTGANNSVDLNVVPLALVDRIEILKDGASAIYGADAVAGVVNTVLQTDFDGVSGSTRYGSAEGTGMHEFEVNLFAGHNYDRGNVSAFLNYTDRSELMAADQDFTETDDLRGLFADYPDFAGLSSLDGRSSHTPWARLSVGPRAVIRSNGTAVTNSSGAFRIQPSDFGCGVSLGNDLCLSSGNHNFNTTNREMRYDTRHGTTVRPSVERINLFLTGHHAISDNMEAFGEVGFYHAVSEALQPPVVNLNSLWIPASNYWNPFGAATLPDGTPNPNRLPGLTNVPAAGLPVQMSNYRYVDTGFQRVRVENYQARFLAGLRGEWSGWNWETALLYSEAEAEDRSPNINMTLLQQQLALSTPDAYNPFSGGCVATPTYGRSEQLPRSWRQ